MAIYPGETVLVNGNNLNAIPGFMINATDVEKVPKRALESYKFTRTTGQALVSSFWDYKEIVVMGTFVAGTKAAFETARDTLLSYINGQGVTLQTNVAGAARKWTVTLSDSTNIPEFTGGYATIELHFNAYDPFGYDVVSTNLPMSTFTTASPQWTWNFSGSYSSVPIFQFVINSLTANPLGTPSITLTNQNTGVAISISRQWSNGDILIVNTLTRTVTVNGIAVPWTGGLLEFLPGSGTLVYTDQFTARNITATGSYSKRYL